MDLVGVSLFILQLWELVTYVNDPTFEFVQLSEHSIQSNGLLSCRCVNML